MRQGMLKPSHFALSLLLTSLAPDAWAAINFRVPPGPGGRLTGAYQPYALVESSSRVVHVELTVDGRSYPLQSISAGSRLWQARIDVSGLSWGPKVLVFTATNEAGETARKEVTGVRSDHPKVVTTLPDDWDGVARPMFRYDVRCVDDDPGGCVRRGVRRRGEQAVAEGLVHAAR
jgi:hypothetical protein